ncbi:squalene/phytoene synthase family protein [Dactylosporangium sp. CA-092794]|uniref:squalene/phytoene synthase family protein n=1 Tax=Dactylosporangium sp. CA-092794 TaxID=3239929 RepID=UPI003D8D4D15
MYGAVSRHLQALYAYARHVDDVGDEPGALDEVARQIGRLYAGRPIADPVVRALEPAVTGHCLPQGPLLRLIEAGRPDRATGRYPSFGRLTEYCTLSANPVGELVLHVFGRATAERIALSNRIRTALWVIEHLRDVPEDRRRGRVYLPGEDMARFGVTEDDLDGPAAPPDLRDLIALTAQRAEAWLDSGAPLVSTLDGRARLTVGGQVAGGRAGLTALARAEFDPLANRVTVPRRLVLRHWATATVAAAG